MCPLCRSQGGAWASQCTATYDNYPLPPAPPEPDLSGVVQRHAGMACFCFLLDCCHNEAPEDNYSFRHASSGVHWDSGDPATGYLYPWPVSAGADSIFTSGPQAPGRGL